MSEKGLVVEFTLPSRRKAAENPAVPASEPVPRIARLLALAHKWEGMVRRGEVGGYAEIAKATQLTTARVSQICSLTLLAPEIQEAALLLSGSRVPQRSLRAISLLPLWPDQAAAWGRTEAPPRSQQGENLHSGTAAR